MSIKGIDAAFVVVGGADAAGMVKSARDTVRDPGGEGTTRKPITAEERIRLMEHSSFRDHFKSPADADTVRNAAFGDISTPALFAKNMNPKEQIVFLEAAAGGLDQYMPVQNYAWEMVAGGPIGDNIPMGQPLKTKIEAFLKAKYPNHGGGDRKLEFNAIYLKGNWHNVYGFVVRESSATATAWVVMDKDGNSLK
jgi:hypothetical protein